MFKKVHVFRVKPEQEIIREIGRYCRQHQISSGVVIGIIGSVQRAKLNFLKGLPGRYETEEYSGHLEIVCAQGSIALKDADLIGFPLRLTVGERNLKDGRVELKRRDAKDPELVPVETAAERAREIIREMFAELEAAPSP